MGKKLKDYLLLLITICLYTYIMFFSNIEKYGKKELENILILAIPCLIFLINSFRIDRKELRRKYLVYYLIIYLLALVGFTFSDSRVLWKRLGDITYVREVNLVPFRSIIKIFNSGIGIKIALYNVIGNFLMLMPLAIILPRISEKFKKTINYMLTIFVSTFLIELIQLIFNYGSFDIDDIILNFLGAIVLYSIIKNTKLDLWLDKLFYELMINKRIGMIFRIVLLGILMFVYVVNISYIVQKNKEKRVDFSNLRCINEENTFIVRLGVMNYYSSCKYDGYVIVGDVRLSIDEYIKTKPSEDKLKQIDVIKKKWLKEVIIEYNNYELKLINDDENGKIYYYGIDSIKLLVDTSIDDGEQGIMSIDKVGVNTLLELKETGSVGNGMYAIFKGEYYNMIGCSKEKYNSTFYNYVVPKDYELSNNFCFNIEDLQ